MGRSPDRAGTPHDGIGAQKKERGARAGSRHHWRGRAHERFGEGASEGTLSSLITTREMEIWVASGVSGCGRIELLHSLADALTAVGRSATVHDLGALIQEECRHNRIPFTDQRILDLDRSLRRALCASALKEVRLAVEADRQTEFHFVGVHATFRWKHRLLAGMEYSDLLALRPSGFMHVVDDLVRVVEANQKNPRWQLGEAPSYDETQQWMMEEELVTEVLADVLGCPMYIVARRHAVSNLRDLFATTKKRIYLSYPITAIKAERPELLAEIQGEMRRRLEEHFVVFDPLAVADMALANQEPSPPDLNSTAKSMIKKRTIDRDFQFIEQADGIVVVYKTDKLSPGVIAEMQLAHRSQRPVFLAFAGPRSPFLEDIATAIEPEFDALLPHLQRWASQSAG